MKTIYHYISPLLTLITMVACVEFEISENDQNSNSELLQELTITGKDFKFDGDTRSAVTIGESGASFTWDEDDVIGIFPDKGDQVSFAMAEGAGTQTATFSGGGWALKSSAKYAAYYPHVYLNRDLTAIPVSYEGQTQNGNANTGHIGAYDFMATCVSTPENGSVEFDMQHLGALVQLTITISEPSTLNKVVLTCSSTFIKTGTIDLTDETPSITAETESNSIEIALNGIITTEADEKVIIYFMTAPVDLSGDNLTVTIHFSNGAISKENITGKNLEAGKAYRLATDIETSATLLSDYIDEYGLNHGKGTEINGVVWAPVNCGYHATDYQWGKLYQWGRRYGQGYTGDATTPVIRSGGVTLQEGQEEYNAKYFFIDKEGTDYDWMYPHNATAWNFGSEESPSRTHYDPCPQGWRVPTQKEISDLSENHSSWTTNNNEQSGYWFSGRISYSTEAPQIFLPAAGCRYYTTGHVESRGTNGYYWSSTPHDNTNYYSAYRLYFAKSSINISNSSRASGFSVRCVQETLSSDDTDEDQFIIPVAAVILSKSSLELKEGESIMLTVRVLPSDATNKIVTWTSKDSSIASVDQDGKITAMSAGNTEIYATADGVVSTCSVVVTPSALATATTDYIDEYGVNHGKGIAIGQTVWAPVNCGYHATDYKWGKLYQWGRRYGQGYTSDVTTPRISEGGVSLQGGQASYNSNVFFIASSDLSYDWLYPRDGSLWNYGSEDSPQKVEAYDPCPDGWRLPTNSEFSNLSDNRSPWTTNGAGQAGSWFSGETPYAGTVPQVFLPAAGCRNYSTGEAGGRGTDGYYWSSRPGSHGIALCINSERAHMISQYRAYGYSVRCVQE